ncbi:MAG: fluoride efflux transporter CrcB [Candidatus Marinimicrobia bacterium]|nr:fluoride efflux transporter CrcB [Candidatus Neomarinimicrobiota bacterium]
MKYLFIAMGGALGAVLRFFISSLLYAASNGNFPWGVLTVNVLGSFILALFVGFTGGEQSAWYFFLAVGLLGAFTTFSTFSHETFILFKMSSHGLAVLNMVANMGLGLSVVIGGFYLGEYLR